jgi:hypothetical protein
MGILKLNNMTKLKLKFYKELLEVVCKDPDTSVGFCYYISYEMGNFYIINGMEKIYPYTDRDSWSELYSRLPEAGAYEYCLPPTPAGWRKRIEILHNLIQENEK